MEQVPIKSVTNVEHERMLVDMVITAIKAKFPSSSKGKPLFIQADNARPHTVRVDKLIEEVERQSTNGWDIRIQRQPPNSPDMNILDLEVFKHLQSLMDHRTPKGTDSLVKMVKESFYNHDDSLEKKFYSLQQAMIGTLEANGDNTYSLKHMRKEKMRQEGTLGVRLSVPYQLHKTSKKYLADNIWILTKAE